MRRFWARFVRLNAPFLVTTLREAARQLELLEPGSPAIAFPILFYDTEGHQHMDSITVKDSSAPLSATVTFLDAKGAPTTADDVPAWSSSDESVATAEATEDGLSASIAIGTPGAAIITCVTTDADGTTVTSQGTVTVQPGEAVIGAIDFEPPVIA